MSNKPKLLTHFFKCIPPEFSEGVILADGLDDCILGATSGCPSVIVYDANAIVNKLRKDGMTKMEAVEYFEMNINCAYVGERTPIYVWTKQLETDPDEAS